MARDLEELLECKYHKKPEPSEYGFWEVLGEDPNCDLGGSHVKPHLGYFEGTFIDVCTNALTLDGFFTWGGGGDVYKAPSDIKPRTLIGNGVVQRHREEAIEDLLHDATDFVKERLGEFDDNDTVEIKFCDLVKMMKDYDKDSDK